MALVGLLAVAQTLAPPVYFPPSYENTVEYCAILGRPLPRLDEHRRDWYSKHLRAAGEPSLFERARAGQADVLRFLWLRTFHAPVIVRIEDISEPRPRMIATELSGQGGYAPGTVKRRIDRALTTDEASMLRRQLAIHNPLVLPAGSDSCDAGMDGSQWIIERAADHRYKLVDRFYAALGPVHTAGLAMLRLTGWKFDRIY